MLRTLLLAAMMPAFASPKGAAAPAGAAGRTTETVDEFVAYRVEGEGRVPLFSDEDEDMARSVGRDAVKRAALSGTERPRIVITRRRCTYPLSADGKRQALGSTCTETDL